MTVFRRSPASRWLVPLVLALLLTAGVSGISALSASAGDRLAPRSAAQLLADVQKARLSGLSGTIVQTANLGLPSIPGVSSDAGSSQLSSLVSGSHTLRLWYAGPDRVRLALLGDLGESDIVRNGTDLWQWSSSDKTASHRTLPLSSKHADKRADPSSGPSTGPATGAPTTPQQAADEALKAIDPSTKVSTSGNTTVAGRSAYELVLEPRDAGSLVGSVVIAIDGATHVPTRVQVFPRGATDPAFEVGFTSFDPTAPGSSVFAFNPPPGTKVTQEKASPSKSQADAQDGTADPQRHAATPQQKQAQGATHVVGKGWTSVLVTKMPTSTTGSAKSGAKAGSSSSSSLTQLLAQLPKVTKDGISGRLLQGTLFSALLTDDGRVAVGAVSPDALYAALGS